MISISDAIPVQFWLNGVESYNTKIEPGIEKICFNQLFNADDEIRIQLSGTVDDDGTYELRIYNLDGVLLDTLEFTRVEAGLYDITLIPEDQSITNQKIKLEIVQTESIIFVRPIENGTFTDTLLPATNQGSGNAWSWNANKARVTIPNSFAPTQRLQIPFESLSGVNYDFDLAFDITDGGNGAGNHTRIVVYLTDGITFTDYDVIDNLPLGAGQTASISITPSADRPYIEIIGLSLNNPGGFARIVDLDEIELTDPLEIVTVLAPEVDIAYSDYLSIKVSHAKTKLIRYSNDTDFAGIIYDTTPVPDFMLRVTAKFFSEGNPEENESEGLSDGSIVKLLGTVKDEKLMEVLPSPFYLHKKLKLVLQHNTIYIDNLAWVKEQNYEIQEPEDEEDPFREGKVWLTKQSGSYVTNPFS